MPNLSFHEESGEESGSVPVSQRNQEPGSASSSPQDPVSLHDSAIEERIFKFNTLSPEHRLLLSLLRPQEQRYFAENADSGSAETLSVLARILTQERSARKTHSIVKGAVALVLGFCGASSLSERRCLSWLTFVSEY